MNTKLRIVGTIFSLLFFMILFVGLSISGCGIFMQAITKKSDCPVSYTDNRYQYGGNGTDFPAPDIVKLERSPMGIPIGPGVDGVKVDQAFQDVAKCLGTKFHACGVRAVMIAPNWFTPLMAPKIDTGATQAFPCTAPPLSLCSGVNQWPATIFITPDHHALYWEVERMLIKGTPSESDPKRCWQTYGETK